MGQGGLRFSLKGRENLLLVIITAGIPDRVSAWRLAASLGRPDEAVREGGAVTSQCGAALSRVGSNEQLSGPGPRVIKGDALPSSATLPQGSCLSNRDWHPCCLVLMVYRLRKAFTFLNGWGKSHKKNTSFLICEKHMQFKFQCQIKKWSFIRTQTCPFIAYSLWLLWLYKNRVEILR